jgi:hypothetical protein
LHCSSSRAFGLVFCPKDSNEKGGLLVAFFMHKTFDSHPASKTCRSRKHNKLSDNLDVDIERLCYLSQQLVPADIFVTKMLFFCRDGDVTDTNPSSSYLREASSV